MQAVGKERLIPGSSKRSILLVGLWKPRLNITNRRLDYLSGKKEGAVIREISQ